MTTRLTNWVTIAVTFLLALPLSAQTAQRGAANPIASYSQRYAVINRELPTYRTVSADMETLGIGERSTDGGKVEAFCKGTETRLIVATDYGEHGSTISNFYFWNNSLFYVQMLGFRTEGVYRGPVERTEDRLDYVNGRLVKLSDGRNAQRPLNTSEAHALDSSIRTDAASFFSHLGGCHNQIRSATDVADTAAPMMAPAPAAYDTGMKFAPLAAQDADTLTGRFIPGYVQPSNTKLLRFHNWVKVQRSSETVANYLNARIKLPFDIRLQFQECQTANAFYLRAAHAVVFCYEYLDHVQQLFSTLRRSDAATSALTAGDMYFTLYHEVGHALVDALGVQIFTAEESAVDGFAIYLLTKAEADGAAEAAVQFFLLQSQNDDGKRLNELHDALADEHALDRPRAIQIACWLYGEDPSKYRSWIRPDFLTASRANRCGQEFEKLKTSWDTALANFSRAAEPDSTQSHASRGAIR